MIEIKTYSFNEFEQLKPFWESLQSGGDMTVFQQYIWYLGLNKQYESGCFKRSEYAEYHVVFKDGKAKMIAPIHIKKHGFEYKGIGIESGIYMVGQWSFTDYLNFIYDEFDDECAQAVIDSLKKKYPRLTMHFNFIKENNSFDRFLEKNYKSDFRYKTTCIQVLPHESFDSFYQSMTKHTRQNIRTALNREIKENNELHIEVFNTVNRQQADEFYKIYIKRSQNKNSVNFSKDGIKASVYKLNNKIYNDRLKRNLEKFNYLIYSMVNNPASCLIGIFDGEKKIGFIYCLRENRSLLRNAIVCFDESYGFFTPGMTAFYRFFKDYIYSDSSERASIIDMTRGTENYKYKLGGTEHYLNNYKIQ